MHLLCYNKPITSQGERIYIHVLVLYFKTTSPCTIIIYRVIIILKSTWLIVSRLKTPQALFNFQFIFIDLKIRHLAILERPENNSTHIQGHASLHTCSRRTWLTAHLFKDMLDNITVHLYNAMLYMYNITVQLYKDILDNIFVKVLA